MIPRIRIQAVAGPVAAVKADAWAFFLFEDAPGGFDSASPLGRRLARMITHWRAQAGFVGRACETSSFPSWESLPAASVFLVGLGKKIDFHPGLLERAAAAATRVARRRQARSLVCAARPYGELALPECLRLLVRGVYYGAYHFNSFRSARASEDRGAAVLEVSIADCGPNARGATAAVRAAMLEGETLAEVRDLANLPGNEATPEKIAAATRALARRWGLHCRVLDRRELERQGCRALLAVGRGSEHEPCVIELRHHGARRGAAPIAIIGKTITFDAGGICLKPAKGMEWMRYDKSGGMAIIAAMGMVARLKIPRNVVGLLAVAENMPDGRATRPGDIVRARSGRTIEIINTDAEGRLILADALSLAGEFKPQAIVDLATLTGAVVVALGHEVSGILGNDSALVERLIAAGQTCGDRLWPLPLWPDYDDELKSHFADLRNVGGGDAGTILGATFLKHFVPKGVPWAHIDFAGPAYQEKARPYGEQGVTLAGAKLLLEWIRGTT